MCSQQNIPTQIRKVAMSATSAVGDGCQCLSLQNPHNLAAFPAGIYLLKVNNRNTRTRCEICSKLTIKTPERRH